MVNANQYKTTCQYLDVALRDVVNSADENALSSFYEDRVKPFWMTFPSLTDAEKAEVSPIINDSLTGTLVGQIRAMLKRGEDHLTELRTLRAWIADYDKERGQAPIITESGGAFGTEEPTGARDRSGTRGKVAETRQAEAGTREEVVMKESRPKPKPKGKGKESGKGGSRRQGATDAEQPSVEKIGPPAPHPRPRKASVTAPVTTITEKARVGVTAAHGGGTFSSLADHDEGPSVPNPPFLANPPPKKKKVAYVEIPGPRPLKASGGGEGVGAAGTKRGVEEKSKESRRKRSKGKGKVDAEAEGNAEGNAERKAERKVRPSNEPKPWIKGATAPPSAFDQMHTRCQHCESKDFWCLKPSGNALVCRACAHGKRGCSNKPRPAPKSHGVLRTPTKTNIVPFVGDSDDEAEDLPDIIVNQRMPAFVKRTPPHAAESSRRRYVEVDESTESSSESSESPESSDENPTPTTVPPPPAEALNPPFANLEPILNTFTLAAATIRQFESRVEGLERALEASLVREQQAHLREARLTEMVRTLGIKSARLGSTVNNFSSRIRALEAPNDVPPAALVRTDVSAAQADPLNPPPHLLATALDSAGSMTEGSPPPPPSHTPLPAPSSNVAGEAPPDPATEGVRASVPRSPPPPPAPGHGPAPPSGSSPDPADGTSPAEPPASEPTAGQAQAAVPPTVRVEAPTPQTSQEQDGQLLAPPPAASGRRKTPSPAPEPGRYPLRNRSPTPHPEASGDSAARGTKRKADEAGESEGSKRPREE